MKRQTRFTLAIVLLMVTMIVMGVMNVLADTTTDAISGTWFGNMHFSSKNAVERVKLVIPACCEPGDVCGTMLNYVNQCIWEITYDGYSDGAYHYHFSNTLRGECPSGSAGSLTLQPDGNLHRLHTTPFFTSTGELNQLPNH